MDDGTPAKDHAEQAAADTASNAADRAAQGRDAAAVARDEAAEARDSASASAGDAQQGAGDRLIAAVDRAATALGRQEATLRDAAAVARDEATEARGSASAGAREVQQMAGDRVLAAEDRAAAARDRHDAALDRQGALDQLKNAYRDDLTGALLREAGLDQLGRTVDRAHRIGEPLTIAFIDVDHLKQVNDLQGHAFGDRLLREAGLALQRGLRSYDIVVRFGGDEFVCALQGSELADAEGRLTHIGEVLSKAIEGASVSIGLAELRTGESVEQVIGRADREMYDGRAARRVRSGAM